MTDLKPCPFCGKNSHLKIEPFFEPSFDGYYGYTVVCTAAGFSNMERGCGSSGAWGETEEDAVAEWNSRPCPTAPALETVGYISRAYLSKEYGDWSDIFRSVRVPENFEPVVTRDNAEAYAAGLVEKERLRFEGDLDKWMKAIGAGITGYQPEAYTLMDFACQELVSLRATITELEARLFISAEPDPGEHQEILDALEVHNSGEDQ